MTLEVDPRLIEVVRRAMSLDDADEQAELLAVGFGSVVLRLGGWIVRVARNADALEGHRREAGLLPLLHDRISVPMPFPIRLLEPSDDLPFGASTYPEIPGRPMSVDAASDTRLASQLGQALRELHDIDIRDFAGHVPEPMDPTKEIARLDERAIGKLLAAIPASDHTVFGERWATVQRQIIPPHPFVLCHGDPWFENLLVDSAGRLGGILDFEGACLADPALDLAAVFHMGEAFASTVLSACGRSKDETLRSRISGYRFLRDVAGFAYIDRNAQREEVPDAVAKIREQLRE